MTISEEILGELRKGPGTDAQLAERLGRTTDSIRRRRQELVRDGLVRATGGVWNRMKSWQLVVTDGVQSTEATDTVPDPEERQVS